MSLRLRRKNDGAEEVPVGAFSDIAFLLIVFFVVTTTLVKPYGLTTELPASDKSDEQVADEDKTNIVQIKDNTITFNEKQMSVDKLKTALTLMQLHQKENDQDRIVLLESSGSVPYQTYYEVMVTISNAGGVIAIMREEEGGGS